MHTLHLPSIFGGTPVGGQSPPCTMTPNARAFVDMWLQILNERAVDMVCSPKLTAAAQKHATWLDANAIRDNRHIGANGSTANERARAEGYTLPSNWPVIGNQIESVGECYDGPQRALQLLVDSPPYRAHLLREGWFEGHCVFGCGNASHYWVILSAPRE